MATSSRLRRRWATTSGGEAHHLIDPRSGLPADTPYVQVTTWASETWRAEVWAKAVLIGGPATLDRALLFVDRLLAIDEAGTLTLRER
jgi:thiamine biosynthesis lipoprotein